MVSLHFDNPSHSECRSDGHKGKDKLGRCQARDAEAFWRQNLDCVFKGSGVGVEAFHINGIIWASLQRAWKWLNLKENQIENDTILLECRNIVLVSIIAILRNGQHCFSELISVTHLSEQESLQEHTRVVVHLSVQVHPVLRCLQEESETVFWNICSWSADHLREVENRHHGADFIDRGIIAFFSQVVLELSDLIQQSETFSNALSRPVKGAIQIKTD